VTRILPLVVLLSLLWPATGGASELERFLEDVRRTTLPNGLTLITRESPGSGVVAINTYVKAGYFHEPDDVAGMAHLFEHMFFKGSKKFPGPEQIAQELSAVGGRTNAGTIYDYTSYYFVVPREGFERAVEIQADAVINPLFDPEQLRKEAEVVIEESNRKLDNPPAVSFERMLATQFTEHRIRRWRIGSNEVLRNIDRDDLIAFFETLYRPENMIVSIAGDVSHEAAYEQALATFGKLARGRLDKRRGPREPPQQAFRFGRSTADIKQGYSVYGWPTVAEGDDDELALDLLATILGGGRSSRLFVDVVGPDAASTASAFHMTYEDVGVLAVQASFDEPRRDAVDRGVLRQIERLRAHGPTEFELQLAKNAVESGIVFALEDALGQATTLASFEADYGVENLPARLDALNALKPADIQRVAQRHLRPERLTLYHYAPEGSAALDHEAAWTMVREAYAQTAAEPQPTSPPALPRPMPLAGSDGSLQRFELDGGLTLIVKQRADAPSVSTAVLFPGGRIDESSRNAGITQLMTRSLRRGTASRSGVDIDREIEFLGTQFGVEVAGDYFGLSFDILSKNHRAGLALLADVLLAPTFPEDGVEDERFQQLADIKRSYDSSTQRPFRLAFEALFGSHPYALPADGYATSIATLDAAALRDWWSQRVVADGALVVVVGNVDAKAVRDAVAAELGDMPRRARARATLPPPPAPAARLDVVEHRDRHQSAIVYAFPTPPRTHEDWPALRLLGNVTSGLAGTFFAELRGRRSLAYTVFATEYSFADAGSFVAYMASDADKEAEARAALLAELRRLDEDGFDAADLSRAQTYFSGSTRIGLQRNAAQAADLARNWFMGVALDHTQQTINAVQALSLEQLREIAGRYFEGERFVSAMVRGRAGD
jgi:zinc protease